MAKDYAAIAAKKITQPSKIERKPKMLIYSRNKKGKTRFAASAPNVLVCDPEWGTTEEKSIDPDVWPIESWEDMEELYGFIRTGKHKYEWLALDGMTRISSMALRWVMNQAEETNLDRKPGQVQQRDYGRAGEMVKGLLQNLHSLPYGIIYTAQERMIEVDQGEEDEEASPAAAMFVADMPKGVRASLNAYVDVIGRLYIVNTTVKVKRGNQVTEEIRPQRRLWIAPHTSYDTGYRSQYGNMPDYLKNPTPQSLVSLLRTNKKG